MRFKKVLTRNAPYMRTSAQLFVFTLNPSSWNHPVSDRPPRSALLCLAARDAERSCQRYAIPREWETSLKHQTLTARDYFRSAYTHTHTHTHTDTDTHSHTHSHSHTTHTTHTHTHTHTPHTHTHNTHKPNPNPKPTPYRKTCLHCYTFR